MDKKKNILIEKYLEQHSLVESNIRSFNKNCVKRIALLYEREQDGRFFKIIVLYLDSV